MGLRLSILILVAGCATTPPPAAGAKSADLGAIPLGAADGSSVALGPLLGRRPALLSFWAPWCEPCLKELPDLERLARAVAPCGGAVVGVAVGEAPAAVAAFTRARSLTYPQLADQEFLLADALGQRRIPATVVLDGDQRILFVGEALEGKAVAALQKALPAPCTAR